MKKTYGFIVMVVFAFVFALSLTGCEEAGLSTPGSPTGVTVSPPVENMARGEERQFTATVDGTGDQTVAWSVEAVEGEIAEGTAITDEGLLTVAAEEIATSLTVRAVSQVDDTKYGEATVTVYTVAGVTVTTESPTVARGTSQPFTATVSGENNPPQEVTWSIEPTGTAEGTAITDEGLLTVAGDETATSLTVRAVSQVDDTKYGVATVGIIDPADSTSIKVKFGILTSGMQGVTETFTALHNFIASNGLDSQPDMIKLGDWIDLEGGLSVAAYESLGAIGTGDTPLQNTDLGTHGKLLRLIVVGINSFQARDSYVPPEGSDHNDTPHVVFQFQNLPGTTRRMNSSLDNTGGYRESEMRKYLSTTNGAVQDGNFLAGLMNAGVPDDVLWAPKRYMSMKEESPSAISDLLWLPTLREMIGDDPHSLVAGETANNQARLEYYTGNDRRQKFDVSSGRYYWLASPISKSSSSFYFIETSGSALSGNVIVGYWIAPAFCVK